MGAWLPSRRACTSYRDIVFRTRDLITLLSGDQMARCVGGMNVFGNFVDLWYETTSSSAELVEVCITELL